MKKTIWLGLLLAGAMVFAPAPLLADEHKVKISGEAFARMEYLDNWDDFDDTTGKSLDFATYLVRIGLGYDITEGVDAFAELQADGLWGGDINFFSNDPFYGAGGFDNDSVGLYQAYVNLNDIGGSSVSLRIGRQEHVLGNELHMGDNDFYDGRYFDGVRAMFEMKKVDFNAFWYTIRESDSIFSAGSNDLTLIGVTGEFEVADGHDVEPYILHYRDGSPAGMAMFSVYTIGALYDHAADGGKFDWSIEAALQTGDANSGAICPGASPCDVSSTIFEGEFGYNFGDDEKHRLHIGALRIGDGDDPNDAEGFMSIAPDTHRRAGAMDIFSEFSSANLAFGDTFDNLTDYSIGYGFNGDRHGFTAAYHDFTATEDFGAPDDAIGSELDLIYHLKFKDKVGFEFGLAQFMPDEAAFGAGVDDPMRIWAMMRLSD